MPKRNIYLNSYHSLFHPCCVFIGFPFISTARYNLGTGHRMTKTTEKQTFLTAFKI